jgi:hypothetical protein
MAKKPEKEEPWVRCEDCKKSIGKVDWMLRPES